MSSRIPAYSRYGLRSRKNQASETPDQSESDLTDASAKSTFPENKSRPASAASRRSYSEVVAASLPAETPGPAGFSKDPPLAGENLETTAEGEKIAKDGVRDELPDNILNDDDDASTWTTVNRRNRRSHSTSSLDHRRKSLDVHQINTINTAYNTLSMHDIDKIARREKKLMPNETELTRKPGPSKGKGVDPRNWGNIPLEEDELDPVAQARALRHWKQAQNDSDPVIEKGPTSVLNEDTTIREEEQQLLREKLAELERENRKLKEQTRLRSRTPITEGIRAHIKEATDRPKPKPKLKKSKKSSGKSTKSNFLPSSQIPPNSFLGRALHSVDEKRSSKRLKHHKMSDDPSDPSTTSDDDSSSSSPSSDSSNESSSSSTSSDSDWETKRRRSRRKKAKAKIKSSLKPTPPEVYDGRADLTAFYRFVSDGTSYLKEGQVNKRFRVRKLSTFLKGRAYDFYLQQVSMNPGAWTLRDFFEGLMNACFPVDLLEQTRSEIDRLWQRDLSVRDYSAQLKQKYDVIGSVSEQEKVIKLWNGFKAVIRAELYRERLNPNISSWDEVVERAELLEVNQGRGRNGNDHSRNGNDKGATPNNPRSSGSNQQSGGTHNKSNLTSDGKPKLASQLTPKELEELRKAGKCFRCKREGHVSKDCPLTNAVAGNTNNKPPGLPSHAIDIDFEAHESLNTDDEPLHELDLGAIGISSPWEAVLQVDSGSDSEYEDMPELVDPDPPVPNIHCSWNTRYIPQGDLMLLAQEAHLNVFGMVFGFPGDDDFPRLWLPTDEMILSKRFSISAISDRECVVIDRWYPSRSPQVFNYSQLLGLPDYVADHCLLVAPMSEPLAEGAQIHLESHSPYIGDEEFHLWSPESRFKVVRDPDDPNHHLVHDRYRDFVCQLPTTYLNNPRFNLTRWYNKNIAIKTWEFFFALEDKFDESDVAGLFPSPPPEENVLFQIGGKDYWMTYMPMPIGRTDWSKSDDDELWRRRSERCGFNEFGDMIAVIELNGQQVQRGTYPSLQRNAAMAKDPSRAVPKPLVVTVKINGHPARALLDSGSLGDFLSTTIVDQLHLKKVQLQTPLALQLAVQGSHSRINFGCWATLEYQDSTAERYFDVANIANYDIILGSTFPLPMKGPEVTTLASRSMSIVENILKARETPA
ncbi:hypothetical protein PTI98_012326 [Pleurotus ostreatus]|nr:hypothetical protein PTI98_012326 [Pleurotus ostreatus]